MFENHIKKSHFTTFQNFIKNGKNGKFGNFEKWRSNSVTTQDNFKGTKIGLKNMNKTF